MTYNRFVSDKYEFHKAGCEFSIELSTRAKRRWKIVRAYNDGHLTAEEYTQRSNSCLGKVFATCNCWPDDPDSPFNK